MSRIIANNIRHNDATTDSLSLDSSGNVSAPGNLSVTGTSTLTDDLVVDTDTLFVDVSTDQVGIGTSSPQASLHIGSGTGNGVEIGNNGTLQVIDRGNSRIEPLTVTAEYAAFSIARNASTTLHDERARFTYDGLTFNGDTAAANALDDYEEGSWSPVIGGTAVYDIQWGRYIKVGAMVHCWGGLRPSSMGTGNARVIQGLPFTVDSSTPNSTPCGGGMIVWNDNGPTAHTNAPTIAPIRNTTNTDICAKTGASGVLQNHVDFWQNNHRAAFFISYRTI